MNFIVIIFNEHDKKRLFKGKHERWFRMSVSINVLKVFKRTDKCLDDKV
jgi:hypothetical protein